MFSFVYLAARCPARVARCPRPRHDRAFLIYCSRHPSSRAPHQYSVPQPQAAEKPFKPSAPPRKHCQRPQLVKGKSPQGSRVTVQIEQYLLCAAAQLTSCSFPAATSSRLTSNILPHVSLGASHLLKPASTTTRSYGRRHRSWHYEPQAQPTVEACVDNTAKLGRRHRSWHHGHVHATNNERRHGQRPLHHDQVHAWRLGRRHGHHDQAPATHNERCHGKRPGRNDEVHATHNERRHHHHPPL